VIGKLPIDAWRSESGQSTDARNRISSRRLILRALDDRSRRLQAPHREPRRAVKRWPKRRAVAVLITGSLALVLSFGAFAYLVQANHAGNPEPWITNAFISGTFAWLLIPMIEASWAP